MLYFRCGVEKEEVPACRIGATKFSEKSRDFSVEMTASLLAGLARYFLIVCYYMNTTVETRRRPLAGLATTPRQRWPLARGGARALVEKLVSSLAELKEHYTQRSQLNFR